MLEALKRVATNAKRLDSDKILRKVFNDPAVKEYVITLQQNQMYDHGVDSKGESLGEYSVTSVEVYGKRPGHIRMYDSGDFFKSIKVKAQEGEIIISADTIKTAWDGAIDLLDRWPELLGLNEDSLQKIRTYIRPLFIDEVRASILA